MTQAHEYNFDGIVGPTYHFGGLAFGNLASMSHGGRPADPRQAALAGLAKMRRLMELGIPQCVLPPHERPYLPTLRQLGFRGTDADVVEKVHRSAPELLSAVSSASAMWAANAATVTPSADATDGKVHLTPASLAGHLHRSIEASQTARVLRRIFKNCSGVIVHDPLPASMSLGDEGAANHMRLCVGHKAAGLEVFAYGRDGLVKDSAGPIRFPARQTLQAARAIARRHRLRPQQTLFVTQNPALIDLGVFHNDVIAVANENVLLYHTQAFKNATEVMVALQRRFSENCGGDLDLIPITSEALSVEEAVATYLFNSQIVTLPAGGMVLIAPEECEQHPSTRPIIEDILSTKANPIRLVHYVQVRQSMQNGGGPACLRLRVVLTATEAAGMNPAVVLTPALYEKLSNWVQRHYRPRLAASDLADPTLIDEVRSALDELTDLLNLGSIYDFQGASPKAL